MLRKLRVALDVSLTSPGIALVHLDTNGKVTQCVLAGFWSQAPKYTQVQPDLQVHLLQLPDPKVQGNDIARYTHITNAIFSTLVVPALAELTDVARQTEVIFEGYAFIQSRANCTYKLHELTGILKYRFAELGVHNINDIANSAWRKNVLGNARANKNDALQYFEVAHPTFDLWNFTGKSKLKQRHVQQSKESAGVSDKETSNTEFRIPSPISDMVEAWCILWADPKKAPTRKKSHAKTPKQPANKKLKHIPTPGVPGDQ